jgi:hypothetical protein
MVMDVESNSTVGAVRLAAEARAGVSAMHSRLLLTCRGAVLHDAGTLADYGVDSESTLHLGGRVNGGGGKKKQKVMPKVQPLEKNKLPSVFICLFCDHKSCSCQMCAPAAPRTPASTAS